MSEFRRREREEEVYDEHVDDWLYSRGWKHVSSREGCENVGCKCETEGACLLGVFNHFMVRRGCEEDAEEYCSEREKEDCRGQPCEAPGPLCPIVLDTEASDDLCVEEVRCMKHTMGPAYVYYRNNVVGSLRTITMVSAVTGDYKSVCFNIPCYLLEVNSGLVPAGALGVKAEGSGRTWVLSRGAAASEPVLESLCSIELSPVVCPEGRLALSVRALEKGHTSLEVDIAGFKCRDEGPNMIEKANGCFVEAQCRSCALDVRAVRTALVTVSILLTPKSMYGGKNPSTKLITYFVHNVFHGGNL